jgi:hypothetical protein
MPIQIKYSNVRNLKIFSDLSQQKITGANQNQGNPIVGIAFWKDLSR